MKLGHVRFYIVTTEGIFMQPEFPVALRLHVDNVLYNKNLDLLI